MCDVVQIAISLRASATTNNVDEKLSVLNMLCVSLRLINM